MNDIFQVSHHLGSVSNRRGVSLIEIAVVVAILGVAMTAAFPMVLSSQEAARRHTCTAHVKQIIQGVLCHDETRRAFPGGGIEPWPRLESYLDGAGRPYGARTQGLGWMYQIASYVGSDLRDVELLMTTEEVAAKPVPVYFCPSRRGVTFSPLSPLAKNDYAAAVPTRSRSQIGDSLFERYLRAGGTCVGESWGARFQNTFDPRPAELLGASYAGSWGAIVRSDLLVFSDGRLQPTNYYQPISLPQLVDGLSRTLVVSEKRLLPSQYDSTSSGDDRGWTDGWDPDVLRSAMCPPANDGDEDTLKFGDVWVSFGSAHPNGLNAAFADGSVRQISYGIDRELLNSLAHRSDGELLSAGAP